MHQLRQKDGFTIIELLVVITIIAILIGILLPSLAGSRDRARYIKWKGYSHSLRADVDMAAYFNFEEQDGTERMGKDDKRVLWNRATVDPMEFGRSTDFADPEDRHVFLETTGASEPQWTFTDARWKGKGGMRFDPADRGYCRSTRWPSVVGAKERNIGMWVKLSEDVATSSQARFNTIAWGGDAAGIRFLLPIDNGTGSDAWDADKGFAVAVHSANVKVITDSMEDGEWHFLGCRLNRPFDTRADGKAAIGDLDLKVRQMHAALGNLDNPDLSQLKHEEMEMERRWCRKLDFSQNQTPERLANTTSLLIANIASLKDHLKVWCEENRQPFRGEDLIDSDHNVALIHDLWNLDKHAKLNRPPRSGVTPELQDLRQELKLSTGGAAGSSAVMMWDPQTGKMLTSTTGSGKVCLVIDAKVVDEAGTNHGSFETISESAAAAWEAALRDAGVTLPART